MYTNLFYCISYFFTHLTSKLTSQTINVSHPINNLKSAIYFTFISLYKDHQRGLSILDVNNTLMDHHKNLYDNSLIYFSTDFVSLFLASKGNSETLSNISKWIFSHLMFLIPIGLSRYNEILGFDVSLFILVNELSNLFINLRSICPEKYKVKLYMMIFFTFFTGKYLILLPYFYYHRDRFEDIKITAYLIITGFTIVNTYWLVKMVIALIEEIKTGKINDVLMDEQISEQKMLNSLLIS
jgi:hypothetical protein